MYFNFIMYKNNLTKKLPYKTNTGATVILHTVVDSRKTNQEHSYSKLQKGTL